MWAPTVINFRRPWNRPPGLLVMGAFAHSRLRRLIIGGLTEDVLTVAEIPVLMSH